ncbi:MAG: glutamate synthase subunit beta [Candidatus Margulisiibacteriota bacterium]|nr:glutamate synthase subunit beta [Candidatus Margulisiibacteriota bacterium]
MGNPKGFLLHKRKDVQYRPVCERVKDYKGVVKIRPDRQLRDQASRCMDCGTPFCNWGCPLGNYIPEWNDYIYTGQWKKAFELLDATNNLPEITGRVCPAPCEYACVLGINDDPVTIRENELAIIEHAFKKGWIKPNPPEKRTRKKVAVIGSGPAGLSCAVELNKNGHSVTVYEKDAKIGGILRYGIPDFKLEKKILDRRIAIWEKEGIKVKTNTEVKKDPAGFDAVCWAGGARTPRDLEIEGRNLSGIHFAMDYLSQANKKVSGEKISEKGINTKGKKVVVVGGGDTGSDCVGTANRQGAKCVVQIELLPQPPECRDGSCPWPKYPLLLKTTSSHKEGAERHWSILTKKFVGEKGKVKNLSCIKVEFEGRKMEEIPGSEFEIEADLVILAVGFLKPELPETLSKKNVFCAGDSQRGPSLAVWALYEGRETACEIDNYLRGEEK